MTAPRLRLNPTLYDALELSAHVYGGIGAGQMFLNGSHMLVGVPHCVYGHARHVAGTEKAFYGLMHLRGAIELLDTVRNDNTVRQLTLARLGRVSWADYCKARNITRG